MWQYLLYALAGIGVFSLVTTIISAFTGQSTTEQTTQSIQNIMLSLLNALLPIIMIVMVMNWIFSMLTNLAYMGR